jgi:putative ABC transport system permease protein
LKKLLAGEVVIGTGLANQLGLRIGQALVLESVAGPVELRIAGIANEYASGGEVVYLEWSKAGALLKIPGPHVFLVTSLKGDQAISPSSIQTFCAEHHLLLQANADLRELIENLPHQLEGALWVLIVLTFLLASLGLTNTLTMNVLEQSRELKTLNAIGMTSSQGRRVILGQMILLALTALLLGTVFGIGLAWLLNSMTNAIFGRHVDFAVRLPLTLGCFVAGMIMTTLASSILGRWKST